MLFSLVKAKNFAIFEPRIGCLVGQSVGSLLALLKPHHAFSLRISIPPFINFNLSKSPLLLWALKLLSFGDSRDFKVAGSSGRGQTVKGVKDTLITFGSAPPQNY